MKCDYCGSHNSADQHSRCVFCGAGVKATWLPPRQSGMYQCATAILDVDAYLDGDSTVCCDIEPRRRPAGKHYVGSK